MLKSKDPAGRTKADTAFSAVACLLFFAASCLPASPKNSVRYLNFPEAEETLQLYAASGLAGSTITNPAAWDRWVRAEDHEVRSRIDRGVEDSISNLILYGTSFTSLPRLEGSAAAIAKNGELTSPARLRLRAFVASLANDKNNERIEFARRYLVRKQIAGQAREKFLAGDLIRFAKEQFDYEETLQKAQEKGNTSDLFATRATLYQKRGLSVDTSLLPNFALEQTLGALVGKGVLKQGSIHSVAIVGPGLDFADKREGYDFYPLQSIQPFAVTEAILRLGLGNQADIRITALDLNPAVNAHMERVAAEGLKGRPCVLQLPRDTEADWNNAAISYWEHFGDFIGTPVKPLPVPKTLSDVSLRAVAVRPELAARLKSENLNIVSQRLDLPPGQGFDLVVATNILVYYNTFEQALAMSNIAHMMNHGGIFLANDPLPSAHDQTLKYLGRKSVSFAKHGEYGDGVVVYLRE